MPDIFRVNNQPYSWNSSISRIDGQPWPGIVGVDFSEKLDIETVYSQTQDGKPIGGTAGQYAVDSFSLKLLRDSADALTSYLVTKAPQFLGGYGRVEFHFQLQVSEPLLPGGTPIMLDAEACRITSHKAGTAKGAAALESEFTLWVKSLTVNGKSLYSIKLPGM